MEGETDIPGVIRKMQSKDLAREREEDNKRPCHDPLETDRECGLVRNTKEFLGISISRTCVWLTKSHDTRKVPGLTYGTLPR